MCSTANFVDAIIEYYTISSFGRLYLHIHRGNEVVFVFRVEESPAAFVGIVVIL